MSYQLIHGDCLEVMPTLESGSVDMILCDLPYGTTACHWDSVIPFEPLWAQYKRIIKPKGAIVLFASFPFTGALWASNVEMFKYAWVWDKQGTANFAIAKYQPLRATEDVLVFSKGSHNYYPQMRTGATRIKGGGGKCEVNGITPSYSVNNQYYPTNIIRISNANFQDRGYHPTQKPVNLLAYLIRTYTNADETIFDNTMGSGSTIVAAIQEGRNAIGIERDADYFAIAQQRCLEATYQPSLFTPQPTQWKPVAMFGDD